MEIETFKRDYILNHKMKYQGIESAISPEKEKEAILEFLDKYWDVKIVSGEPVEKIINYIFQEGIKCGIDIQEEFNQFPIDRINSDSKKIEFKRTNPNFIKLDDIPSNLKKQGWNISAQPKEYESFKQTYDEFNEPEIEELEFSGSKLHCSLAAGYLDFKDALTKKQVYTMEISDDKSPLASLIDAVYFQGMSIGIQVVDQKWDEEINKFI